jgi:aryl-alcohol dehydrogenase-like predicted oxidoreductase
MDKRDFLRMAAASPFAVALAACGRPAPAAPAPAPTPKGQPMHTRNIPSSGEALPVIGCGTWQGFDRPADARAPLEAVLKVLFEAGGSVVDSSPMYGLSEAATGDVLARIGALDRAFLATKVWTSGRQAGIAQMQASMRLLGDEVVDLMQVHNLLDWRTHLDTLAGWKAEGRVRYVGVTHYTASAYAQLEEVMRARRLDFVQLNYSADDRRAEARLLPLAAERGMGVVVNMPFGGGGLLRRLGGRPLPDWAGEIGCASWAQLLLKFVLGHPAVTCVIPGTGRPEHMADNVRAGFGALPDDAMRERIARAVSA